MDNPENTAPVVNIRVRPIPPKYPMEDTRTAITHKFDIAGHEGFITVATYEDGQPGELFITMNKEGSTIGGLLDTIASLTSLALQYGIPLDVLVKKFVHYRFEPSGFTKHPEIRNASSIVDYVFRWMGLQFMALPKKRDSDLAPPCPQCGHLMIKHGQSFKCPNCLESAGEETVANPT